MKKLFLDLDGTLAKFNVRNALERFDKEIGFFERLNAYDGFEIMTQNQSKDYNNSSNSLFENNSFAGMNVQFENTDKEKARQDANNFLLNA